MQKLYEVWKLLEEMFPMRPTRVLQLQPFRNEIWKKVEDDGKSYKIINGAYACTKTLISRLFLVEKEKNHMMCEICSKRPFKCDQPEFCSLSCLEIRVNRNKCFCKKKNQGHLVICPPSPTCQRRFPFMDSVTTVWFDSRYMKIKRISY